MRFGYSFWGFLGDVKCGPHGESLSTPDGNATYSWSILYEAQKRGWTTYLMQEDRDLPGWLYQGSKIFSAFSSQKRLETYKKTKPTQGLSFPELDVLLLEWRFPIPGRNTLEQLDPWSNAPPSTTEEAKQLGLQPDLVRQWELLNHYGGTKTRVILWDLDHKLTYQDEDLHSGAFDAVFETSVAPLDQHFHRRVRVEPPTVVSDLLQFPTQPIDPNKWIAYIGSRYERDEVIERYLGPVQRKFPGKVHFYGKWEPRDELAARWPGITYHDRCTVRDFWSIYRDAGCVPLLAKESYLKTGFITPRPWEAVLFGSFPIGLSEARGASQYAQFVFGPGEPGGLNLSFAEVIEEFSKYTLSDRDTVRRNAIEILDRCDAKFFVDQIERVTK